jgi:hypothetical protein
MPSKLRDVFDVRNIVGVVKCMAMAQPQAVKTDVSLMRL